MRRIGHIERLRSKLDAKTLGRRKLTKESGVEVDHARSAQIVDAAVSKSHVGHWGEGERIKVGLTRSCAAENRDLRFDLIGGLRVAGRIQRCGCRRYRE